MSNIFYNLFLGNINPLSQCNPTSFEYQEKRRLYSDHFDSFFDRLKSLSPDLSKDFDQLTIDHTDLECDFCLEQFQAGFSLGVGLILEACSYIGSWDTASY